MHMRIRSAWLLLLGSLGTFAAGPAMALGPAGEEQSRECVYGDCENGFGILEIDTEYGTDRYEGNFQDGEFHGFGTYERMISLSDRAYYEGHWEEGERDGRGTYWDGESDLYIGEWEDDMRHGEGAYYFGLDNWSPDNPRSERWLKQNTQNYTGEFVRDLYQGEGVYRWPDGKRYEGEFYANERHGRGTFYYPTGTTRDQVWEHGELVED